MTVATVETIGWTISETRVCPTCYAREAAFLYNPERPLTEAQLAELDELIAEEFAKGCDEEEVGEMIQLAVADMMKEKTT